MRAIEIISLQYECVKTCHQSGNTGDNNVVRLIKIRVSRLTLKVLIAKLLNNERNRKKYVQLKV